MRSSRSRYCRRRRPSSSWYDGGPQNRSADGYLGEDMQAFRAAASGIADDNGTTTIDDPRDELILNAQTVQMTGKPGR